MNYRICYSWLELWLLKLLEAPKFPSTQAERLVMIAIFVILYMDFSYDYILVSLHFT